MEKLISQIFTKRRLKKQISSISIMCLPKKVTQSWVGIMEKWHPEQVWWYCGPFRLHTECPVQLTVPFLGNPKLEN